MIDLGSASMAETNWPLPAAGAAPMRRLDVRQLKAARELLGWSQKDLQKASGVSIATIKLIEMRGGTLTGLPETRAKIMVALEKAGIDFPENGLAVRLLPKTKGTKK